MSMEVMNEYCSSDGEPKRAFPYPLTLVRMAAKEMCKTSKHLQTLGLLGPEGLPADKYARSLMAKYDVTTDHLQALLDYEVFC
jgi:hypothetical protein